MGLPKPSRPPVVDQPPAAVRFLDRPMGCAPLCLSPQSASDVGVVEVAAYRSPSVCVTASTCRRRADGRMYCRESAPAHVELHELPIRDGECNKHAEGKVIFAQLQMGGLGMGEWVAEQRGTDQDAGWCELQSSARLGLCAARPHHSACTCTCTALALHLRPRSTLALAAVARCTFVTVLFTPVTRYRLPFVCSPLSIAYRIIPPCCSRLAPNPVPNASSPAPGRTLDVDCSPRKRHRNCRLRIRPKSRETSVAAS
jgi:hypothetical protein